MEKNKTDIIFDKEVLCEVIGKIYDEYSEYFSIGKLTDTYYTTAIKKQNEIRDKLDEVFKNGILKSCSEKKKSLKQPDYFALFMCFVFYENFDRIECWEDVIDNLSTLKSAFDALDHINHYKCCCSHKIVNKYAYKNMEAQIFVIVGCICIKKNLLGCDEIIEKGYIDNGMKEKVKKAEKNMRLIKKNQKLSVHGTHVGAMRLEKEIMDEKHRLEKEIMDEKHRHEMEIMDGKINDYIRKYSHNGLDYVIYKMRRDNVNIPCFIPLKEK